MHFLIMFLLQKGLIVNARNSDDPKFSEDKIYQFDDSKVADELYYTADSSFNSSKL